MQYVAFIWDKEDSGSLQEFNGYLKCLIDQRIIGEDEPIWCEEDRDWLYNKLCYRGRVLDEERLKKALPEIHRRYNVDHVFLDKRSRTIIE